MAEMEDPFGARLSPWLEGELGAEEAREIEAHLATCAACARELEELRAVLAAARELGERVPERDLWPGIERAIAGAAPAAPPRAVRWPLFLAGAAAGFLVAFLLLRSASSPVPDVAGERYLLLLHGPAEAGASTPPAARAAEVDEMRRWARGLRAGGALLAGEKLADGEGRRLSAEPSGAVVRVGPLVASDVIGGFFVVHAASLEEALRIARGCPTLARGGWIELRRIEET